MAGGLGAVFCAGLAGSSFFLFLFISRSWKRFMARGESEIRTIPDSGPRETSSVSITRLRFGPSSSEKRTERSSSSSLRMKRDRNRRRPESAEESSSCLSAFLSPKRLRMSGEVLPVV